MSTLISVLKKDNIITYRNNINNDYNNRDYSNNSSSDIYGVNKVKNEK